VNSVKNTVIIVSLLVIITPLIIFSYIQYKHHITEKETYKYLIDV